MKVRQEETTPIGDYFHDSGVKTIFNAIESSVDEFDVDTDMLVSWIDTVISDMKGLKTRVKNYEAEYLKMQHLQEIEDMKKRGAE